MTARFTLGDSVVSPITGFPKTTPTAFASGGVQNPTLTILALAMRASEYLIDQKKKGQI